MAKKKLTDPFIRNYPKPDKRTEIYDENTSGLALRVTKTGHKSFVYRYRYNNRVKRFTMGSYPKMGLAKARKEVKRLAYEVSQGIDPIAEKRKNKHKQSIKTFKQIAQEFKKKHLPTLRESTQSEYERIIDNELIPAFGRMELDEITKRQIIHALDKKAIDGKSPTMANRIRARLSRIYTFAISRGLAETNPVTHIPTYEGGHTKRERFYSKKEIKKIWEANEVQREPGRSIIKMLFITGQRLGETRKMKWDCIKDKIWSIPSEDVKTKNATQVPLTDLAIDVIQDMKPKTGNSKFVFESPVNKGEPIQDIKRIVKNVQGASKVSDFRAHDIRRTVMTHMASLRIDRTVLGKLLNHKGLAKDSSVTAIYDRFEYMDEQIEAMQEWSAYLTKILKDNYDNE